MVYRDDSLSTACKDFEQDLVLYYYGECAEAQRSRVDAHIKGCAPCREFLRDMGTLLPLTVNLDEPPQAFWQDYSTEMRSRLAAAEQKGRWWQQLSSFFPRWPVPALAMASALILAIAFTSIKGRWDSRQIRPADEAILEVLPIVENLEFFETMELLDSLEKPEGTEAKDRAV